MWIVICACVGVFALFVIFDQRKKIFKIRKIHFKHKVKTVEKTEKKEEKKESKVAKNISFDEGQAPEAKKFDCESIDVMSESKIEYSNSGRSNTTRRPYYNETMGNTSSRRIYRNKKSIKEQIKELSPEMKGVLLSNALGKKDNF